MLVCPNCSHRNPTDADACAKCSTPLTAAEFVRGTAPEQGSQGDARSPRARDLPIAKVTHKASEWKVAKEAPNAPIWWAILIGVMIGTGGFGGILFDFWFVFFLLPITVLLLIAGAMMIGGLLNRVRGRS